MDNLTDNLDNYFLNTQDKMLYFALTFFALNGSCYLPSKN